MGERSKGRRPPVADTIAKLRGAFVGVGLVSMLINVLMLTGPMFMLQIYDRVLASGSVPTLVVLSGLALTLYLFFGILEGLRARTLARIGQRVDASLATSTYQVSTELPLLLGTAAAKLHPVRDLNTVRGFLSGAGPAAIFDAPWLPLYLALVFVFHPILGVVATAGAVCVCLLIALNEVFSRKPAAEANTELSSRSLFVDTSRRHAEAIRAMGMLPALRDRWGNRNRAYHERQQRASDVAGFFATSVKTFRFILQSAVLGVGAWLAILQEITPGVMIAASIITARALAPIDLAVGQWRSFVAARQSMARLKKVVDKRPLEEAPMALPLPSRQVDVANAVCAPPGIKSAVVKNVTFCLSAGDGLGIIGPSGAGKSTLARAIVGVAPLLAGTVRFDGAERAQWSEESIGAFIGYLPQDVQMFDGTVAENISRFQPEPPAEAIIAAARLAGIHDLVLKLPHGYDTVIGAEGFVLSAGQTQRVALARALYGSPFLVVLDEPNSNLDTEGEAALTHALRAVRQAGSIVIVVAHRPSAIAAVDTVLCLAGGEVQALGPKEDVLAQVVAPVASRGAA